MTLEAIRYSPGSLQILDQLQLPEHCHYEALSSVQQASEAIRAMKVRGAPAIALVGCLSLAVELRAGAGGPGLAALVAFVRDQLRLLVAARPTAVNMARAARDLGQVAAQEAEREGATEETVRERYGILDQSCVLCPAFLSTIFFPIPLPVQPLGSYCFSVAPVWLLPVAETRV